MEGNKKSLSGKKPQLLWRRKTAERLGRERWECLPAVGSVRRLAACEGELKASAVSGEQIR